MASKAEIKDSTEKLAKVESESKEERRGCCFALGMGENAVVILQEGLYAAMAH